MDCSGCKSYYMHLRIIYTDAKVIVCRLQKSSVGRYLYHYTSCTLSPDVNQRVCFNGPWSENGTKLNPDVPALSITWNSVVAELCGPHRDGIILPQEFTHRVQDWVPCDCMCLNTLHTVLTCRQAIFSIWVWNAHIHNARRWAGDYGTVAFRQQSKELSADGDKSTCPSRGSLSTYVLWLFYNCPSTSKLEPSLTGWKLVANNKWP
jgi:hypothetical protein